MVSGIFSHYIYFSSFRIFSCIITVGCSSSALNPFLEHSNKFHGASCERGDDLTSLRSGRRTIMLVFFEVPFNVVGHHIEGDVCIKHVSAYRARLFLVSFTHVRLVVENRCYAQRANVRVCHAVHARQIMNGQSDRRESPCR